MYDTARRVALVKQRVRENTRRRQRREAISLSAFCLMLFTALAGAADALIVRGQTAAWGVFGAMLLREDAGGYVLVGVSALQQRWSSPRCASGSGKEKIRKKAGQISRTGMNRRRKANEETNTQHPAADGDLYCG